MPRSKQPPAGSGPLSRLARELQELRRQAGLTYDQMVPRAHFSKTTLATADAGKRLPSWYAVEAYVTVCGGDVEHFWHRWQETARRVGAPSTHRPSPIPGPVPSRAPLPDPGVAGSVQEYLMLLRQLREWAGRPTYRQLSTRARRRGLVLARSTLGDLLTEGRCRAVRVPALRTYLTVCGLTEEEVELWLKVHATLTRARHSEGPPQQAQPTAEFTRPGRRRIRRLALRVAAVVLGLRGTEVSDGAQR
jgi:DNA-binding XRE family transcriptional regulator